MALEMTIVMKSIAMALAVTITMKSMEIEMLIEKEMKRLEQATSMIGFKVLFRFMNIDVNNQYLLEI